MDAKTLYRNSENLKQQYSKLLDTDKALAEECWAAAQILKAEANITNGYPPPTNVLPEECPNCHTSRYTHPFGLPCGHYTPTQVMRK
jgi:hypothetical protein